MIVAILLVIWRGGHNQWHRRWLEYRRLSETLRQLRLLAPLGAAARLDRPGQRAGRSHGWISWYARAIEREIPLPNLAVDGDLSRRGARCGSRRRAQAQIDYNRLNAHAMHKAGRATALRRHDVCSGRRLHFASVYLLMCLTWRRAWLIPTREWAVVLTALFPTVGAAINAIRARAISNRWRNARARQRRVFETLDAALADEPLEFARLADRVEKAADVLTADVAEWHVLFRTWPLSLPA